MGDPIVGAVHPHGSGRVYPNFPDQTSTRGTDTYPGDNYERLQQIRPCTTRAASSAPIPRQWGNDWTGRSPVAVGRLVPRRLRAPGDIPGGRSVMTMKPMSGWCGSRRMGSATGLGRRQAKRVLTE